MPEGDSVHRAAARIRADLEGRALDRLYVRAPGPVPELEGTTVSAVEVRGKHLLIHIGDGWTLRIHLGMKGRWRRELATTPPARDVAARLQVGGIVWECRGTYQAELLRRSLVTRHPRLAPLGPDVLAYPPDLDEMTRRASLPPHGVREIASVLLDQRIASGVGNVYKSEVLFLEGVHPRRLTATLDPSTLRRIYARAHDLMSKNLGTRRRETVPLRLRRTPGSARLWAYRRSGKPCLRCGDDVRRIVQEGRSTYFCPTCQPDTDGVARE